MTYRSMESPTEVAVCASCPATFTRRSRKRGKQVALWCPLCRKERRLAYWRARYARKEAEREKRHARYVAVEKPRLTRPEMSPEQQREAATVKKQQQRAGMVTRKCAACPVVYVTRPGENAPPLCPDCALKGLPPLDARWGHLHMLARAQQ